ncbi:MAG TPA: succinate dehydrogenase cytochrome b subunit [Balneolaceae bacterium]|nr:succinate dehydrogenase cytochrome b subunit [Balneolaceae bacterium]
MSSFLKALKSQVGRKVLSSLTGFGLIIYIMLHLAGNLTIFGGPHAFNLYAHGLHNLGWFLHALEIILAIFIVLHAYIGISVWLKRQKSRPKGYKKYQSKGKGSHQNWASKTMMYTGLIILAFIVWHLLQFRFGHPGTTMAHGKQVEDLKALVIAAFHKPWIAFAYVFAMIALGFHLSHGLWSAFTSLSMKRRKLSKFIYGFGFFFAVIIAAGFIIIPMYIFFAGGV